MFSVIIDADGLPGAVTYFQTFHSEPSPLGTIDFDPGQITPLHNATVLTVLNAATAAANTDILLICHGFISGAGLFLPLIGNTAQHADKEALQALITAEKFDDQATQIAALPEGTDEEKNAKLQKWRQLFDALQKDDLNKKLHFGGITGQFTAAEAKNFWENTVLPGIAGLLLISKADLRRLLDARRACVRCKLGRLEIRSCDTGKDPAVLKLVRDYFGATKATAPKLETLYHVGVRTVAITPHLFIIERRGPFGAMVPLYDPIAEQPRRQPWRALMPLTFWLPLLPDPLTDAPHRKAAKQAARFDVPTQIPELADPQLNNPRAVGGGGRQRPVDIAANGAHRDVWFGVELFIWKFDEDHFRYDAVMAVSRKPAAGWTEMPPPSAASGPDRELLEEFVRNRINARGAAGLRFIPIAALWNPTSGTEPFFLPLEKGYVASIISV